MCVRLWVARLSCQWPWAFRWWGAKVHWPLRVERSAKAFLTNMYTEFFGIHRYWYVATAQYERSGTRASAHPDPDPDLELRIRSPNSVPDPSVPDHRMQYLKSDVELGVRSVPVPYLFYIRSRPNKVFSTYSPCITVGTTNRQSSFHTLGSSMRSRPSGSDSIGTCTRGTWF